jgi:hypothetical protein
MWNITVSGTKEVYVSHNGEFVARFKYHAPKASARHFVKFLVANFTPTEYFMAKDIDHVAPLTILQRKGYVSYNMLQSLRAQS